MSNLSKRKIKFETDTYEMEVEIDDLKIPDEEIERRKAFCDLKDLKILYKFIEKTGGDESFFTFRVVDFNKDTSIVYGDEIEKIIVCKELFCYVFEKKDGYIQLVTHFETML